MNPLHLSTCLGLVRLPWANLKERVGRMVGQKLGFLGSGFLIFAVVSLKKIAW